MEEWKKDELRRVEREREMLKEQHALLVDNLKRAEAEERALMQRQERDQAAIARAVVLKAQRQAKVTAPQTLYPHPLPSTCTLYPLPAPSTRTLYPHPLPASTPPDWYGGG